MIECDICEERTEVTRVLWIQRKFLWFKRKLLFLFVCQSCYLSNVPKEDLDVVVNVVEPEEESTKKELGIDES